MAIQPITEERREYLKSLNRRRPELANRNLPPTTPPDSVDQVNNIPDIKIPTLRPETPDVSQSNALMAGSESSNNDLQKMIDENASRQLADTKTRAESSKSFLSQFAGGAAKAREEAQQKMSQENKMLQEDLAERRALQKEYASLQEDYDKTMQRKNEAIENIEQNFQGTTTGAEQMIRSIEKDYAKILNSKASTLNAKASYIQVVQGNITEAKSLIDQAVNYAVADYQSDFNLSMKMYEINEGLWDKVDSIYSTAFSQSLTLKKQELDDVRQDAKERGRLVLQLAGEGIDASRYLAPNFTSEDIIRDFSGRLAVASGTSVGVDGQTNAIDLLQAGIDAGISPEQAARNAAAFYEEQGIQIDLKTINAWTKQAKTLKKAPTEAVPPPTPITPEMKRASSRETGKALRYLPEVWSENARRSMERSREASLNVSSFFSGLFGE